MLLRFYDAEADGGLAFALLGPRKKMHRALARSYVASREFARVCTMKEVSVRRRKFQLPLVEDSLRVFDRAMVSIMESTYSGKLAGALVFESCSQRATFYPRSWKLEGSIQVTRSSKLAALQYFQ